MLVKRSTSYFYCGKYTKNSTTFGHKKSELEKAMNILEEYSLGKISDEALDMVTGW